MLDRGSGTEAVSVVARLVARSENCAGPARRCDRLTGRNPPVEEVDHTGDPFMVGWDDLQVLRLDAEQCLTHGLLVQRGRRYPRVGAGMAGHGDSLVLAAR
jgi:hypothetical protein